MILALTVISVFSLHYAVKYDIIRFGDHSELILHGGKLKKVGELTVGYIDLGGAVCDVTYCLTDLYHNEFWTETLTFE